MATCRHCGETVGGNPAPFTTCVACADSPLCDACGHPRSDHGQVYVRGVAPGCRRVIGDFPSLTARECECSGFRPIVGRLADASFAEPSTGPLPRLRTA